jgi:hypothetical protein
MSDIAKRVFINSLADLRATKEGRNFRLRTVDEYGTAEFVGSCQDAKDLREWLAQYLDSFIPTEADQGRGI